MSRVETEYEVHCSVHGLVSEDESELAAFHAAERHFEAIQEKYEQEQYDGGDWKTNKSASYCHVTIQKVYRWKYS